MTFIKDPDDESKQLDYSFDIYDPRSTMWMRRKPRRRASAS